MWVERLHPRDEYGRFRLSGATGHFDRLAARVEAQGMARHIEAYRQAGRELAEFSSPFAPEAAGALARRKAAKANLPRAWLHNMVLHTDGTWRDPERPGVAYDSEGLRLPPAAVRGWTRVGDNPDATVRQEDSFLAGGVWHEPGQYYPGRVPKLVDDYGHTISRFRPGKAKTRTHRERRGAFVRAEMRAERFGGHRAAPGSTREFPASALAPAEIQGAFMASPLNPVGRRRSARVKQQRQQNVTWVQRLNARMEGR